MTALDAAVAAVGARARVTAGNLVDALASRMVTDPKLIMVPLYRPVHWPPDEPLSELLQDCRDRLEEYRDRMRRGLEDTLFHVEDLRAAERALTQLIARGTA